MPGRTPRSLARSVLAVVVLLNIFVVAVVALNLRRNWEQRLEQASTTSRDLSRLLEHSIDAVFDKLDRATTAVVDEHARQLAAGAPDGAALDAVLAREKARTPDLLGTRMADATGRILRGVPASEEHPVIAGRDYFEAQRDPGTGLFISRPSMGRLIKVPLIFLSRRLSNPDGSFAGIVTGTITLEHIASILGDVDVGPHGATVLRYQDLTAVVRRANGVVEPFLVSSPPTPELHRLVGTGLTSGAYVSFVPGEGRVRSSWFRKVGNRPFYVIVAQAHDDLLAAWWREAAQAAGLVLLFAAATSLGAWYALRSLRKQQAITEALRESETRLAATFTALPDALAISSLETGQYLMVNEGFTRMFGWPAAEAVGKTSLDLGLWGEQADRARAVEALTTLGAVDDREASFRRCDRSRLTGLFSGRVVSIEGQRYLLTITRDVTRQRQLEAQIQQAQRLESVGRLAGGVAHDFNNMLSVILGEAALLAVDLPQDHPAQEGVRAITRAGERSRDLTRQLLAFSRKQAIAPRVVDLNTLVQDTRPALARLIGEDIVLTFEPSPDVRSVRLDPSQFDQVLVNLVVNARDAMPRGGRLILRTAAARVDTASGPELAALPPGDYAVLTVSDDGHGMEAETLAHLFEPFFTTKVAGKGTGLGLATIYGIVKQNGGAILVKSAPGQGTTFSIYLPATADEVEAGQAPAAASPERGAGTILLVEDEAPVRRTSRRLLESLGYAVLEAPGGEEALALAREAAFDLLVTDVVMPGMKGPELAQQLQARRPGLPVVFMSGHAADVLGSGVQVAGLLQKPFTLQDLARRVREALPA